MGLKLSLLGQPADGNQGPQSNQRGIETQEAFDLLREIGYGLNRTSVGLKLWERLLAVASLYEASIEPAWD